MSTSDIRNCIYIRDIDALVFFTMHPHPRTSEFLAPNASQEHIQEKRDDETFYSTRRNTVS